MRASELVLATEINETNKGNINLYPYVLEAQNPARRIFVAHFPEISFVAVPNHNLILWHDRETTTRIAETIAAKWTDLEFNADGCLVAFGQGSPSHYPGIPSKGSLGCSIIHLQAVSERRSLFTQKEYLPSDKRKDLGQYDTPFWIALHTVTSLLSNSRFEEDNFFLDPMAGEGSFLEASLHAWIVHTCKNERVYSDSAPLLHQRLKTWLSRLSRKALVGVEVDAKRLDELNSNFKGILRTHGIKPYAVGKLKDFFSFGEKSEFDFSKAFFVGNPCWDVIESTTTVRSRSGRLTIGPERNLTPLLEARVLVLQLFQSLTGTTVAPSECRNVYILTILHCLNLSRFRAPIAMLVPMGILGDQSTGIIRKQVRMARASVFVEEYRNRLCGTRIFPAVDARVQFCGLTIVGVSNKTPGLYVKSHDPEFCRANRYTQVKWEWISRHTGQYEQWLTFKSNAEATVANKILRFPSLEDHPHLSFTAGSPGRTKTDSVFEGKDIESFRLRRDVIKAESVGNYLFVRKILPNGGRKMIAAQATKKPQLSDSLLCVESASGQTDIYYLSGVLNSLVGEYRLRLFQSNMNLNLWRLKEFNVPTFDSQNRLHREVAKLAEAIEQKPTASLVRRLNEVVQKLYNLTDDDFAALNTRVPASLREAA